jgi:L-lactate utilization protein LutC
LKGAPLADRSSFLSRIRDATARGRAHRAEINPDATHTAAWVGGGSDPVASLLAEWKGVGGQGARVTGLAAAQRFVGEFVGQHKVRNVVRWRHSLFDRLELDAVLGQHGARILAWDDLERQPAESRWPSTFAAELGITSVDWAVAETGTLALCARPGQGRVVSLLPPLYLAIVEPAQIVPDLFDLFERLEAEKKALPSTINLVTGPSKTGDIELKLTTGVHGPGAVHLLVVE